MSSFIQDIRYAFRVLMKTRGATAIIIVTLALGVGANTAVFSVVNAVLVKPPRVADPDSLVRLWSTNAKLPDQGVRRISAIDCLDWREQADAFEEIGLFQEEDCDLTGGEEAENVTVVRATANVLPLLGIDARVGRLHGVPDDAVGAPRVAVLMDSLWQRRFAGSPDAVGRTLILDGEPHTIIGVLPPHMDRTWTTGGVDIWTPLSIDLSAVRRASRAYEAIGRLKAGASVQQAQAEMDGIAAQLTTAYPDSNADTGVRVQPFMDNLVSRETRLALLVLLAAVGFVLLIACANVANLLLVKSAARRKELTVRAALGADRWRIMRQLFTESVMLALGGGMCGLLLGVWGVDLLAAQLARWVTPFNEIRIDTPVLLYTLALSCAAALVFGVVPAVSASRANLAESLKSNADRTTSDASRRRLRSGFVIGQVSLALLLVVCTGLMTKSLLALRSVDLGFDSEHLLTMRINLSKHRYAKPAQRASFYHRAVAAVEALPGVEAAGAVYDLPLGGFASASYITLEGRASEGNAERNVTGYMIVTPGYFETMKIPLLSGRLFTDQDDADSTAVLINDKMARQLWPNQDAIGKRFRIGLNRPERPWNVVVGVIGDVHHHQIAGQREAQFFLPHHRDPEFGMTVVARTAGDPLDAVPSVQAALRQLDPDQPIYRVSSMNDLVGAWIMEDETLTGMLGVLAAIAMSLACVGLYGVMSYAVAQRTHEIGIRIALGADRAHVLRLVLGRCLVLALLGVAGGLVLSAFTTRALESLLYEVNPADPTTFMGVSVLLLTVALVAGYLPARRATKVDPMVALRCE